MRCPKCGYISFDHLEACLKCKKNIKAASEALQGGVLQVTPPVFLNLQPESQESQQDEYELLVDDEESGEEYVDPDLDVILEEDSDVEPSSEVDFDAGKEDDSADFEISMDDFEDDDIAIDFSEDDEIAIDLGQDGDDAGIKEQVVERQSDAVEEEGESEFEIEMPEELTDMSDLAPPSSPEESELSAADSFDDVDSLDIDLDDFDFDLGSDLSSDDKSAGVQATPPVMPSLDEIDFSDTIGEPGKDGTKKKGKMDMDEDLNFDLDLGGLSIHDDI